MDEDERKEIQELKEFLIDFNMWRRGAKTQMPHPKTIGINIDRTIRLLRRLLKV